MNHSWIDPPSAVARDFMPSDRAPQLEAGLRTCCWRRPTLGRASSFVDRHPNQLWLGTVHEGVSELSRHERARILGETAIEAYGL